MNKSDDKTQLSQRRNPSQGRSRKRMENILDTAETLLLEKGFDAVTTVSIAERAQIPVGSIYYIFPSKFAIFYALYQRKLERVDNVVHGPSKEEAEKMDWEELLDITLDGLGKQWLTEQVFPLLSEGIRNTPEMRIAKLDQDERSEGYNMVMLNRVLPHVSEGDRHRIARVMVQVSVCMLNQAMTEESEEEAAKIIDELKLVLKQYIKSRLP